ncbi:hypothetical protein B1R27_17640, partial [Streptomyces sp. GKU 895]
MFVPGDPARTGRVAFWDPEADTPPGVASGTVEDLSVVVPGEGGVTAVVVPAVLLPVRSALPVLTRVRAVADGPPGGRCSGARPPCTPSRL